MSIFVREFLLFLIILISPVNDDCNRTPVFSFSRLSDRAFRWDMQVSWIKNFSVQRFARHPYVEPHWTQNLAHQFNYFIMLLSLMDELNIIFFYVGNFLAFNNCVAEWSWVPGMSRGYHLWHSQPLDRVTSPWLANPRPPTMSPHANGAWRHGGKRMIKRLNEENGSHENTVLSTWRWCKQGWPRLSQTTDRWPRSRSLLLTVLNKYLFNLI